MAPSAKSPLGDSVTARLEVNLIMLGTQGLSLADQRELVLPRAPKGFEWMACLFLGPVPLGLPVLISQYTV